jgi:hypothetical protein
MPQESTNKMELILKSTKWRPLKCKEIAWVSGLNPT